MRKTMRSGRRWWGLEFSHLQIAGFTLHTFFSSQCQFYLSIILTIFKVVRRLSRSLGYFHYLSIYTLRKISLPFPRIEEGYLRHCSLYVNSKSRKKILFILSQRYAFVSFQFSSNWTIISFLGTEWSTHF